MKKLKLLLVVMMLATLTGCGMKAEYGIVVSKDKNVKIEIVSAMDDEMIDYSLNSGSSDSEKEHTDKERWEYLENSAEEDETYADYTKTKYDKDGYKGYTYSLKLGSIDELINESGKATDMESIGKDSKIFTKKGDVYSLNIKVSDDDASQMEQYAQYVQFDLKLKVTLPNKAKSNNATTVSDDGLVYTWDLTKASSIDLSFDLDGASSNSNLVYIVCGAAVAVALVVAVIVLNTKNKPKTDVKASKSEVPADEKTEE